MTKEDVLFHWAMNPPDEHTMKLMEEYSPDLKQAVFLAMTGALCFGKNKNGTPKHPLYLKAETKLIKFNQYKAI